MSFPAMTPFEVISLGDISISLARGHYQFASTLERPTEAMIATMSPFPLGLRIY